MATNRETEQYCCSVQTDDNTEVIRMNSLHEFLNISRILTNEDVQKLEYGEGPTKSSAIKSMGTYIKPCLVLIFAIHLSVFINFIQAFCFIYKCMTACWSTWVVNRGTIVKESAKTEYFSTEKLSKGHLDNST